MSKPLVRPVRLEEVWLFRSRILSEHLDETRKERMECQNFIRDSHSKWGCQYQVVFLSERWREAIFGPASRQLSAIFHALAKQCQIIERHLMPDHVHNVHRDSTKAAGDVPNRLSEKGGAPSSSLACPLKRETSRANISGLAVPPYRLLGSS